MDLFSPIYTQMFLPLHLNSSTPGPTNHRLINGQDSVTISIKLNQRSLISLQKPKTTDKARSSRDPVRSKSAMFLRAIGRPLLARVKQTTGIVGLDVVPNARAVLINLYTKTLNEIEAVPQDEGYRKAVESFTRHRLTVCEEEEEWERIEKRIGCGQVEELIEEAQDELKLIGKMIEWDPWGVPDDYECEIIENDAPIPKHVPRHIPGPLPAEFYQTLEAVQTKRVEPKGAPAVTSGESQSTA